MLEFKRLGRLKEKGLTPESFDKQVLIDLFGGNSIFSYHKKCWVDINELIFDRLEELCQTNELDLDQTRIESTFVRNVARIIKQKSIRGTKEEIEIDKDKKEKD